jgi:hypothetical protein
METTLFDEQLLADADNMKGEETSALLAGLFTVTPASAAVDNAYAAKQVMASFLIIFI